MKKQTAVEWLISELKKSDGSYRGFKNIDVTHQELLDKAKAIEKEQIEDAWLEGNSTECDSDGFSARIDFDNYYNETYKESQDE
jgi:hypothetical protein